VTQIEKSGSSINVPSHKLFNTLPQIEIKEWEEKEETAEKSASSTDFSEHDVQT
jgi:hypothetical protein